MFKASVTEGSMPVMVNPGDVIDLDRFTAMMVIGASKAEFASEGARILVQTDYVAPARPVSPVVDPIGAVVAALNALTEATLGQKSARMKGV
jgi:hypothetical protein